MATGRSFRYRIPLCTSGPGTGADRDPGGKMVTKEFWFNLVDVRRIEHRHPENPGPGRPENRRHSCAEVIGADVADRTPASIAWGTAPIQFKSSVIRTIVLHGMPVELRR